MKRCLLSFALLFAVATWASSAEKPLPPPHFVPVNVPGATETSLSAINNAGAMTGSYLVSQRWHGFAMVGNKLFIINVPGTLTFCQGINNAGQIVGYWENDKGTVQGFLYQNGIFTNIGPNSYYAYADGINDLGQIVGGYAGGGNVYHGFLYDGTTYTDIDFPGASTTTVTSINNAGVMVIVYTLLGSGQIHSALYDGTAFTNIDVPGALDTSAYAINNNGDVAFEWDDGQTVHAAVLRAGTYHNFGYPGYNQSQAFGINDYDDVVGYSFTRQRSTGWELIP